MGRAFFVYHYVQYPVPWFETAEGYAVLVILFDIKLAKGPSFVALRNVLASASS
jgi:hypothetical protein